MLPHIGSELLVLAELCSTDDVGEFKGWSVDVWEFDEDALVALRAVYDALLLGGLDDEIAAALEADGIDTHVLLTDDESAREVITRSDLTELAGAAAVISVDHWPYETMALPNVPKGSRARSEVGIDILAAELDFASDSTALVDGETLFIGSVKHTVNDPVDCRYKLVKSISPNDLTLPYVTQQLRILSGRLEAQGLNGRRVYLFLRDFPDGDHVEMAMTGAVDATLRAEFLNQMHHLPQATGSRRCRLLLFADLEELHELIDDD